MHINTISSNSDKCKERNHPVWRGAEWLEVRRWRRPWLTAGREGPLWGGNSALRPGEPGRSVAGWGNRDEVGTFEIKKAGQWSWRGEGGRRWSQAASWARRACPAAVGGSGASTTSLIQQRSVYDGPDTLLGALHPLTLFTLTTEVGPYHYPPLLQMKKLRHEEAWELSHLHRANGGRESAFKPRWSSSRGCPLTSYFPSPPPPWVLSRGTPWSEYIWARPCLWPPRVTHPLQTHQIPAPRGLC